MMHTAARTAKFNTSHNTFENEEDEILGIKILEVRRYEKCNAV